MTDDDGPGELLRTYLRDRDLPCPTCRYNLRDLRGSTCPECGDELELRLSSARPRLGFFIGVLLPLAMGLGFYGLVGTIVVFFLLVEGFGEPGLAAAMLGGFALVFGMLVLVWCRRWHRARLWTAGRRAGLLAWAWLGLALSLLLFYLLAAWLG
ncbi:MAG: hypothetical protein AAFX79_08640 [Planctomycetota bacterium]